MQLRCTKKLLDELKIKPEEASDEINPIFSWHVNIIKEGRRKIAVFVHDMSRYAIVLDHLKAKDLRSIETIFYGAIRATFRAENIKEEIIDEYLGQAPSISFSKTKNRTCVARLNKQCENALVFIGISQSDSIIQVALSKRISRVLAGEGKGYIIPNEELYKALEGFSGKPIFETGGLELKITLHLQKFLVTRTVVVPKNISFPDLHETIQTVFGWQNYHLHEFAVYPAEADFPLDTHFYFLKRRPNLTLVCDDESLSYQSDHPKKMEHGETLITYLPAKFVYTYDFGDDWKHIIEVVREVDDFQNHYPVCTDGSGNTPPEDVGGEGGFEEFLAVWNDPSHPDHEHITSWGISNGYEEFNIKMVNGMLKNL